VSPHDTVVPRVNKLFALNNWRPIMVPGANGLPLIAFTSQNNALSKCTEYSHALYVIWEGA